MSGSGLDLIVNFGYTISSWSSSGIAHQSLRRFSVRNRREFSVIFISYPNAISSVTNNTITAYFFTTMTKSGGS